MFLFFWGGQPKGLVSPKGNLGLFFFHFLGGTKRTPTWASASNDILVFLDPPMAVKRCITDLLCYTGGLFDRNRVVLVFAKLDIRNPQVRELHHGRGRISGGHCCWNSLNMATKSYPFCADLCFVRVPSLIIIIICFFGGCTNVILAAHGHVLPQVLQINRRTMKWKAINLVARHPFPGIQTISQSHEH